MDKHACASNVANAALKRHADGKKATGTGNAKKVKVRRSRTTILDLNEDCWIVVMKYLNVKDQLSLTNSNVCSGEIFKRYASHRYKHIGDSITRDIDDEELKQLLQIVGEHLVSYEAKYYDTSTGEEQQLSLLRNHCSNLQHLVLTFQRTRSGWDDLYSLKKLKSFDTSFDMGESSDFVSNLKQLTCLRKLKLHAWKYSGKDLHTLEQLESLDVSECAGFKTESLIECCQTMKKLRHLDFGDDINISKDTFKILLENCQQLERLFLNVYRIHSTVPYELVAKLPRLKHLKIAANESLRDSFIEKLINKQGSPLESLILYVGDMLPEAQVQHLCNISTLKELRVSCATVPLEDLLKLKNLLYLHIDMPITIDQIRILVKGLPHLKVLNLRDEEEQFSHSSIVNSVRTWINEESKQRGKLKIYIGHRLRPNIVYADPLVEINGGSLRPILFHKELSERDEN